MRRIIQLLFLFFFTYLFCRASYPLTSWIPVDFFLRTDPLLALTTTFSSREINAKVLPAVILIGLTLLFGRFFCGYICPLGTLLDLLDKLLGTKMPHFVERLRVVKFYLLIIVVIASLTGSDLIYLLTLCSFSPEPIPFCFIHYPFFSPIFL